MRLELLVEAMCPSLLNVLLLVTLAREFFEIVPFYGCFSKD